MKLTLLQKFHTPFFKRVPCGLISKLLKSQTHIYVRAPFETLPQKYRYQISLAPRKTTLLLRMCVLSIVFSGALGLSALHAHARTTAYYVMDFKTGEELASYQDEKRIYPASLTKVMTLYLVFSDLAKGKIKMSTPLHVSYYAASVEPSKLGLQPGSVISVKDAILALVTKSANDAATVFSDNLASSRTAFARRMTHTAWSLGMTHSRFTNASGLPNPRQKTTAKDLAILARRIKKDFPQYYKYFATKRFYWKGRVIPNHDHLLKTYPGTTGLKTGYTKASGYNLITIASRGQHELIGVVIGSKTWRSRDKKMIRLLNASFESENESTPSPALPDMRIPKVLQAFYPEANISSHANNISPASLSSPKKWAVRVNLLYRTRALASIGLKVIKDVMRKTSLSSKLIYESTYSHKKRRYRILATHFTSRSKASLLCSKLKTEARYPCSVVSQEE